MNLFGFFLSGGIRAKAPECLTFIQGFLCILNETDYNKETNVNLCSSSAVETKKLVEKTDRNISALQSQATLRQVQHICLLALVQAEFKRSAFFWPQIWASGEDQHPSQFWQFAKTQTGLGYKSKVLIAAEKCSFGHWGSRKPRETGTHSGEEEAKYHCFFSALETYDANIYAWGWEEFLGHLSALSKNIHVKGELITVPKFENVLMSEFCSIYMTLAKNSQLPAYHKSLLSLPSSSPLKPLWFLVQRTKHK